MEINRTEIEQWLAAMKPTTLTSDAIDRMERALMCDQSLTAIQSLTENKLEGMKPLAVDPQLEMRLLKIVEKEPFRLNEKVVMFPASAKEQEPQHAKKSKSWYAAAAVAVAGGMMALLIPYNSTSPTIATNPNPSAPVASPLTVNASNIVTTSYGSEIERTEDRGVIWDEASCPKRVWRVQYQDRVLVRDASGVERMLFLPREELIVFPEKID